MLPKLANKVNENSEPLLLLNKKGNNCYLVSEEYLNELLETIYLNSQEGLADIIIKRGNSPLKNFVNFNDLI